jgi:predicted nucleotidyltransferase/predicted transcriptional regulator with HTH domain
MWLYFTTHVVYYYHMLNLHSKVRQRLLTYYFANPAASVHLRDLAGRLDVDPSNLSKELRGLEREGLFRSELSGRQKYFRLNTDYPLYAEVRGIVEKTIGAVPLLAHIIRSVARVQEAYLYGSFARNQQDAASDIDILLIGDPNAEDLAQAIETVERRLGREINYTTFTSEEFKSRLASHDSFLENAWGERVPIVISA